LKSSPQKFTVTLAGAAVFSALAALLTLSKAALPFPLIPYLQIDFAELPIYIAFFLFGPVAAIITELVHWLFLNITGSDAPLGPAVKLVAVLSTLCGFWAGSSICHHLAPGRGRPAVALSLMFGGGMFLRVVAMTVVNYIVLLYVGPVVFGLNYMAFARATLVETTGWQFSGDAILLFWVLVFTALYNVINLLAAAIPAGLVVSPLTNSFRHITSLETWLMRNVRAKPSSYFAQTSDR
jgi:riboflavin transporter FmnP